MAVLAVGVEVAILAVMVGLSWTTGFVLFSVRKAVFIDISVQAWGMVQVGASNEQLPIFLVVDFIYPVYHGSLILVNCYFRNTLK